MNDTIEIMAEEFKIAYPLTYDAVYEKGRSDAIDEFNELLKNKFNIGYMFTEEIFDNIAEQLKEK